ncbi:MAG TPA: hypothetical protein VF574_11220 [Allosphingosinicella sp.]|jgi:hypothetical protein
MRARGSGGNAAANGRWAGSAKLALICLALTPVTIVIHELGHFTVALLSGLPAELHATSVSGGASPGSGAPASLVAMQAGAGPMLTILMSLAGALLYRRGRSLWALAFAFAAASRLIVPTAYLAIRLLFIVLGRPFGGRPVFDEYLLARALGILPELAALAATLFLATFLGWLLRRPEPGRRLLYLLALTAAAFAGNLLWPALAPGTLASTG